MERLQAVVYMYDPNKPVEDKREVSKYRRLDNNHALTHLFEYMDQRFLPDLKQVFLDKKVYRITGLLSGITSKARTKTLEIYIKADTHKKISK